MRIYFSQIWIILILSACSSTQSVISTNSKNNIYSYQASSLHPKFKVYHTSDDASTVYFRLNSAELMHVAVGDRARPKAIAKIKFRLMDSYESTAVADSGSFAVIDSADANMTHELIGEFKVKAEIGRTYVLEVEITDLNRKTGLLSFVNVAKNSFLNAQNFLVKDASGFIRFENTGDTLPLTIQLNNPKTKKLTVRYYNREFPLAAPPFSTTVAKPFDYRADSIFHLHINPDGTFHIHPTLPGMFLIQPDSMVKTGLTITNLGTTYPYINTIEDMVGPLRYITTKKEFDALVFTDNQKLALDSFWLALGTDENRSRELISYYYNRVHDANYYFTSYQEGWRTDRGMIYIVFGPPNIISRTSFSESWIYGEENNYNSITFNFTKVENPFTDNDYSLNRSSIYKGNFYKAVDYWRQGRMMEGIPQ